ncbi:MAG: serine/threonine protein kinase, partial [Planctomycetaceae bacterium]|nr:serine/threonine protein kinase [Planctomycetaceae bacterium]
HRDIKPANILLENGVERVKITDFGLARAVDDITVTRTGEVSGTPQYMSPEQASGERVDHRSDLFSLGCVMYAMCTGHSPFRGDSVAHVIKRVTQDTPRPIAVQNPEIPGWLSEIVTCLLQKNPEYRFQTAEGVVAILDQHLQRIQHPTESGSHSVINQQLPVATPDTEKTTPSQFRDFPNTGSATTTDQPQQPLIGNCRVMVPEWLRSISRVLLLLVPIVLVALLTLSSTTGVAIGPMEFSIIFTILGIGPGIMAMVLCRRTVGRYTMAAALFAGLGPLGLLIYFLLEGKLQPAPDVPANAQPEPQLSPAEMPRWLATPVLPVRLRISNVLLCIGVPALFGGLLTIYAAVNRTQLRIASFPPINPEQAMFWLLGLAVVTLLPAAFLRVSEYRSPPSFGSLIAWFLVGGPIGIIIWLYQREIYDRKIRASHDGALSADERPMNERRENNATALPQAAGSASRMPPEQEFLRPVAGLSNPTDSSTTDKSSERSPQAHAAQLKTQWPGYIAILVLMAAIGAAYSAIESGTQYGITTRLIRYPGFMFTIWAAQCLMSLVRGKPKPLGPWALLSGAAFSAAIVAFFWTTILRLTPDGQGASDNVPNLIEVGVMLTLLWIFFCVYVGFTVAPRSSSPTFA